ncbi:MAG: phosphonoacetaldehyde reductase [Bacteroidales bacterium]|nr:phosphonoacetaldehyde reductase [Candidatus Colicola equi]
MKQLAYLGHTALISFKARLAAMQIRHLFLVRGNASYVTCGAEAVLTPIFNELGIDVVEYKEFSSNPKIEEAQLGLAKFMGSQADCIVAVGGGSVMDMAKLIRYYAAEQGNRTTLLALPTTAGTGAEATHFAVVYIDGKKQSIEADDILPDMAFVYPPFTYGNNAYLTACTGFDALAQAIEAFWNKNATPESDEYALKAISYIHHQLPQCVHNSTNILRDELAIGAYWAGRAINITKTTAPHAFSYAFTSKCGYPHGHAVALIFPFFAELNLKNTEKEKVLRWILHIGNEISLQTYFLQYIRGIGLDYRGVGSCQLVDVLNEVNLQRLANNPVVVNRNTIQELCEFVNSL